MINRLFQLTCILLLAVLILRILGKSEQPVVSWASQRFQQSVAKSTGKAIVQSSPQKSKPQARPQAQTAQCPAETTKTDSIYLGEALALQFKKQASAIKSIAQMESQLGKPNCKGTGRAVWLTTDGKAIIAIARNNKISVLNFSGF